MMPTEGALASGELAGGELGVIAQAMRILGHETRLRLVDALRVRGEQAVGELEAATGIGQPGLSQQLAILRRAELVRARRAAKRVYYSLAPEALTSAVALLTDMAGGGKAGGSKAGGGKPASAMLDRNPPICGSAAMFAKIL